jgi:hypothetical protein
MRNRILIGVTALLLAIPAISIAGDRFNDVPSDHTFHNDIAWLADRGITRGCNPPANDEFCPEDSVTRGQMSAFIHRFANTSEPRLTGTEGPDQLLRDSTWVALDSLNVQAPADGGALLLNGSGIFFIETDTDAGGFGLLEVTVDQNCSNQADGIPTLWETLTTGGDSATVVGSIPVTNGTHTVRLCALAVHLDTSERTEAIQSRVTALWASQGQVETLDADASEDAPSKTELLDRVQEMVDRAGD